jgi:hypothetical protein
MFMPSKDDKDGKGAKKDKLMVEIPRTIDVQRQQERLHYYWFARAVLDVAPKALRYLFEVCWNDKYALLGYEWQSTPTGGGWFVNGAGYSETLLVPLDGTFTVQKKSKTTTLVATGPCDCAGDLAKKCVVEIGAVRNLQWTKSKPRTKIMGTPNRASSRLRRRRAALR